MAISHSIATLRMTCSGDFFESRGCLKLHDWKISMHDHHLILVSHDDKCWALTSYISLKALFIPGFLLLVILYNPPTFNIIFNVLYLNSLKCIYHYAWHTGNKMLISCSCNYYWASITCTNWSEFASRHLIGVIYTIIWFGRCLGSNYQVMNEVHLHSYHIPLMYDEEFNVHFFLQNNNSHLTSLVHCIHCPKN